MEQIIDFTDCERVNNIAYGGANGKKIGIKFNNSIYMVKFPPSGKGKRTELSYTNSCISEHLGSSIFNLIGINAQETMLGKFSVNGEEKIVCVCKDFAYPKKVFTDFSSIKNTIIDSEHSGTGTELADILETIDKQLNVNPVELKNYFWNMFIVDALLGNFDRHNGNWGFINDYSQGTSEIAPVFDCGSCLLPQADTNVMMSVLNNEAELNARIFNFPVSAIRQDGNKINYFDFISKCNNADCNKALLKIYRQIDMKKIIGFINEIPLISDFQKEFYSTYIEKRYEYIIKHSYEKLIGNQKNNALEDDEGLEQ